MENDLAKKEADEETEQTDAEPARPASRLPLILTLVSLLVWFGFQAVALTLERNQLSAVNSSLDAAARESEKMRAQLEGLITQTVDLAGKGNANARIVIEELQKRGIPLGTAPPAQK
jgi:cell division protein FtsB